MSHTTTRKAFAFSFTGFSISPINYINIITNPLSLPRAGNCQSPRFKACLMHYCTADQETDILVCVRHHISPSSKLILPECALCRARTLTREHSCIFKYHVNSVMVRILFKGGWLHSDLWLQRHALKLKPCFLCDPALISLHSYNSVILRTGHIVLC